MDTGGLLLAVVVTIAGIQDRDAAHRLLTELRARFCTIALVWADGGYAGRLVIWTRNVLSLAVEVVKRTDDVQGFKVLPRRWVVERTCAWISKYRRCVRDYETLPAHHETMVHIAMIMHDDVSAVGPHRRLVSRNGMSFTAIKALTWGDGALTCKAVIITRH